jgi:hypothetical protein
MPYFTTQPSRAARVDTCGPNRAEGHHAAEPRRPRGHLWPESSRRSPRSRAAPPAWTPVARIEPKVTTQVTAVCGAGRTRNALTARHWGATTTEAHVGAACTPVIAPAWTNAHDRLNVCVRPRCDNDGSPRTVNVCADRRCSRCDMSRISGGSDATEALQRRDGRAGGLSEVADRLWMASESRSTTDW